MTTAVLAPPVSAGKGPVSPFLDAELAALLAGPAGECLVCGAPVEVEGERVECGACGSILEPAPEPGPDQLALI